MARSNKGTVLSINGGSSSIKFAIYVADTAFTPLLSGAVENIGTLNTNLNFIDAVGGKQHTMRIKTSDHQEVVHVLMDWLEKQDHFASLKVIGHRVVHGMSHTKPEKITIQLLGKLKEISAYDPEHLPEEIKLIELFHKRYPSIVQVACFDTAFHAVMPTVAKLLPIPRRFGKVGIRRYGFHGLSYAYLMEELEKLAGKKAAKGRVIVAHLGSGASLAAVKNGNSMDTSMGFTPSSGIPMSTRTGDLDPGVAAYLIQHEQLSPHQFNHLVNHESGLLGISETSASMEELLQSRHTDHRVAEAIDFFCYQTRKYIGAYAAVLGGLDTLVFSGGIGEHAPEVRKMICTGLQFLGIELDKKKNTKNEAIISKDTSKVVVRVIPTNEELMIARLICRVIKPGIKR